MSTYRMIAIDIDDTLLTDEGIVTDPTRDAMKLAMDRGAFVTLATGRMYASAKQVAGQIGLNVPLITYQGSLIKNLVDEHILFEKTVPPSVTSFLFDFAAKQGLHLQAYYDDQLYAREENDKLRHYCQISNVPYVIEPDFAKLSTLPMTKLLIYDEPAVLDELQAQLMPQIGHDVHMTKSKPYFLEFMHKEGTKGHALQFLAGHFKCELSEVIAVGDSWNDSEMLQAAGLGVAVANAVEPLKQIADVITASNNEEGVRQVIEQYLL